MMTPQRRLEILTGARARILDPAHWGQLRFEAHNIIDRFLMRPARLCLMGAVNVEICGEAATWTVETAEISQYLAGLTPGNVAPMTFNDCAKHSQVIGLLDLAITLTEDEIRRSWAGRRAVERALQPA